MGRHTSKTTKMADTAYLSDTVCDSDNQVNNQRVRFTVRHRNVNLLNNFQD